METEICCHTDHFAGKNGGGLSKSPRGYVVFPTYVFHGQNNIYIYLLTIFLSMESTWVWNLNA